VDGLAQAGRLRRPPVALGSVGVGIAIRVGGPEPAIRDEASLRAEIAAAEAIVFNRASTGLYMDRLFARLGLTEAVTPKAVRFPDGDAVLRRIAAGSGREIAFAAMTEIGLFRDKGVRMVGPLPDGLQNRTPYAAALLSAAEAPVRLVEFLASPAIRAAMVEAGLEAPAP
jgi:molybdate transport system substrate-binding protein